MSPELEAAHNQVKKHAGRSARLREQLRVKEQALHLHLTACAARDAELDRARAIVEAAYAFTRNAAKICLPGAGVGSVAADLRKELDYAADGGPEFRPCICFETPHLDALRTILMVDGDADYADGVLGEWQAAVDKLKDRPTSAPRLGESCVCGPDQYCHLDNCRNADGPRCVHCGRTDDGRGGNTVWARVGDARLCHPDDKSRPDCYHLVTVYGHQLADCANCKPSDCDWRATCCTCNQAIHYLDAPTGGWWAHDAHPADEHDAAPVVPVDVAEDLNIALTDAEMSSGTRPSDEELRGRLNVGRPTQGEDEQPTAEQQPHTIEFKGGPAWHLWHPAPGCPPGACPVHDAAVRTLTLPSYQPGEYTCTVGPDGWLQTRAIPGKDDQGDHCTPACETGHTRGDGCVYYQPCGCLTNNAGAHRGDCPDFERIDGDGHGGPHWAPRNPKTNEVAK